ncbi:hypothetical protein [Lyngbya sp. CCY1209]|mgnify:CR=1 FL=1|jgi:hypothetical protein|uniref:hypothetical protein n=1 Tax=Lyngbya sp. CCY1209 TaxID=2886103 RepID=UPI002D214168|nr:hypothetical protein [Lyngbya sp. CCY1209]MEB3886811.1 hypothetical protein [Lyngbya sp. CCY1209]
MFKRLAIILSPLLLLLYVNPAYAIPPAIITSWQETLLAERPCLERAEIALRDTGFSDNFDIVQQSVFGDRGEYTASIRCIPDKEMVFFIVVGYNSDERERLINSIKANF